MYSYAHSCSIPRLQADLSTVVVLSAQQAVSAQPYLCARINTMCKHAHRSVVMSSSNAPLRGHCNPNVLSNCTEMVAHHWQHNMLCLLCWLGHCSAKALSKYTEMVDNLIRQQKDKLEAASDEARLRLREWDMPEALQV